MNFHNSGHGRFYALLFILPNHSGWVVRLKTAPCYALFKLQEALSEKKEEKKTYAKGEEILGPNREFLGESNVLNFNRHQQ